MLETEENELDEEWIKLISEAIKIGLSKEEVRSFIMDNNKSIQIGD